MVKIYLNSEGLDIKYDNGMQAILLMVTNVTQNSGIYKRPET